MFLPPENGLQDMTRKAYKVSSTSYLCDKAIVALVCVPGRGIIRICAATAEAHGITVNVVQAGLMDTDMASESKDKLPPMIMEPHAIKRFVTVEEVAAAIVFLSGPDASSITGSVIDVNGGFIA